MEFSNSCQCQFLSAKRNTRPNVFSRSVEGSLYYTCNSNTYQGGALDNSKVDLLLPEMS